MKTWKQISNASNQEIIAWAAGQSWAQAMAECSQDKIWHAEGDVWTHTCMVCDELVRLDEWSDLSRATQLVLLMTAIFHDAGKPATTYLDPESGRIRSPKHAEKGMRIARRTLLELGCDVKTREQICFLVLFHGRPPYLSTKSSPREELIKLSWFVDHRLMRMFVLADSRGRICETNTKSFDEPAELWELVADENDCLERPYSFLNDHARFLFFRGSHDALNYEPFESFRCTMTVLCGLPGSGKNTWLSQHRPDLPVVSLDTIRNNLKIDPAGNQGAVVQAARQQCREYLRANQDFAFNATNTTRSIRKLWIDLGASYDAKIAITYVEPTLAIIKMQNAARESKVPVSVIDRLIDKLDPPTLAECHQLLWVTGS